MTKRATPAENQVRRDLILDGTLEFMRLLWQVAHGLGSTSKRMSVKLQVTGPQRLVIRILGQFGELSAGQLARTMCVHPSTLTGVLRRLEEHGLVDRSSDPADGRRAIFGLTARGRQLDAVKTGTVEAAVRRVLSRVSARQLEGARALLQQLGDELGTAEPAKVGLGRRAQRKTRGARR